MTLTNKVAVVTGASRGIGKAIATELATAGASVIGTATSEQGALRISEYLGERGFGLVLDVSRSDSIATFQQALSDRDVVVDILVNNAAVTRDNLLLRMKDEDWLSVIDTDLNSIYSICKCFLKGMVKSRWGRIINISSVVGVTGNAGQTNYASAKAGMLGFTKALAQEVGSRGVTVNAVAPGFIETDMTDSLSDEVRQGILNKVPMKRLGSPLDIAKAVAFLASEHANYITGETLHINGGMYMN